MASLVRIALLTSLLLLGTVTSPATMIYNIRLYNASGRAVDLMYRKSQGTWARWAVIPAKGTKTFSYYGGVALRFRDQQFVYTRVDPPSDYISPGLFGVRFDAQLTPDLKIYLLPPSTSAPAVHLPAQPKGFPLRPITQRSNQSVELTATRRAFTFSMTKPLPLRATLALGVGSSLHSR